MAKPQSTMSGLWSGIMKYYRHELQKKPTYAIISFCVLGVHVTSLIYDLFIPFLLFVFRWFWPTKLQKCLFTFFKSLACLALQTETIVNKIMRPKSPETNKLTKI